MNNNKHLTKKRGETTINYTYDLHGEVVNSYIELYTSLARDPKTGKPDQNRQLILSVDIGTTSVCALVLDVASRRVITSHSVHNDSMVGDVPKGFHEQDPGIILATVQQLTGRTLDWLKAQRCSPEAIEAMVVTGQMHGILLVDEDLRPCTNLITWCDQRTADAPVIEELGRNADISAQTGCRLASGYGGSILHWLKHNRPELFERELQAVSIVDYVVAQLTGVVVTDVTMAASWGVLDIRRARWNECLLAELGLHESMLPEIRASAMPLSTLSPRYRGLWPLRKEVHVCTGLGDNQASVFAMGILKPGTCVINIGTGAQISIIQECPDYNAGLETRPLLGNKYIYVGSSLYGGWAFAYLGRFFQAVLHQFSGADVSLEQVMDYMNRVGETADDDAAGLLSVMDFMENREGRNMKGAYQGIDTGNLTPANLCRATVNAIVDELYGFYELSGMPISSLYVSGNAIHHNHLLHDTIARKWALSPSVSEYREEAAVGAAYLAAVNTGLLKPDTPE